MSELGGYELPKDWRWATIPDLVGEGGVFMDGDWVESKDQDPNGDVRLIQLADVGDGSYRDRSSRFLTADKAHELGCTFLRPDDVLIARMPDPLGRSCIFPGDSKQSVTVVDVCVVRSTNGEFDHRWLSWFVNAHPVRSAISGLQAGSTRKRISRGNLATIPLPVPPLPEQHRIVAEIEKQFTRLDAGVAALLRAQANLKRYRASVLKAACEGTLVPTEAELARAEGRECESGAELLERILDERRNSWAGRGTYKEPAAPDIAGPPRLPEGWCWATVEQVSTAVQYGTSAKTNEDPTGIPVLRMGNIQDGKLELDSLKYLPVDHAEFPSLLLAEGDLLFNRTNSAELVGKSAIYHGLPEPSSFASYLIRVRFAKSLDSRLAGYFINSVFGRAWISNVASQQVGQANVNGTKLQALAIPLPPFAEQQRIVAEVERRLSVIDELEAVVAANLQRATRLRQAVLQRAFSGEL